MVPREDYSILLQLLTISLTWTSAIYTSQTRPDLAGLEASRDANHSFERDRRDFGFVLSRLTGKGLEDGWFSGYPIEMIPGGLHGVATGLANLSRKGQRSQI